MQQRGKPRGVGFVIVLTIFTLGIYGLYWLWRSFAEIKRWRGQGVGGFVGLLLTIVIVGVFLLPSYVGRLYRKTSSRAARIRFTLRSKCPSPAGAAFST